MDIRHQGYQELLFQEIRTQIVARGMDGVFLDTVADIDEVVADPLSREEMRLAYTTFLKKVRGEFPFLLLIQNRAFETLDHSAPHLDGVLWEDWRGDLLADPWVQVQLGRLRAHKKPAGLRVFAVSAGLEPIHRETAQAQGFVHLSRPDGYDRL
ncbi:MAG TPA: hypothetical protein VFV52_03265, partial [Bacilli bacterium]|nr:hypothetical protein [Bacilli bacterium]